MRIAIVTEYFPRSERIEVRGGVEARAYYTAKHLAKKHDVTVIASREHDTPQADEFSGIRVLRPGTERSYSHAGALRERLSFISEGRKLNDEFDIVDGYSFLSYPLAWRISQRQRIPGVATYHDLWIGKWMSNLGLRGLMGEALERYALRKPWNKFIACSSITKSKLTAHGIQDSTIAVVPNGVDLDECSQEVEKFPDPTICCISRLVKYKHVDVLIRALAILRRERPSVRCKIIGVGPEDKRLRKLSADLNMGGAISFLGFLHDHSDVIKTLKSSHALALPSTVEGFGIALLEAMASGVPYAATDIPAFREASQGKGGLLFKPLDYEDLAAKLLAVLDDDAQKEFSSQGLKHARNYDWGKLAAMVERIYGALT